ncbi:family 2A encapsulin nanocompartment cargo protein cysteine desulfurase [Methylomonas sp. CM2]|uniref:family 2A encapsulin nanocompartment cargo protein cysteine desulfurase n=1 Tax=Methylomonas sp. CM2 TaxID=3417647 RepID=UPI003CF97B9D
MTTPNPDLAGLARQALNGGPVPAGLPDTAELSRLANLYYSDMPTSDGQAIDNVPASAASSVPYHAVPNGFANRPGIDSSAVAGLTGPGAGLPGLSELQRLVDTSSRPPVGPGAGSSGAPFYFLNELSGLARAAQIPGLGSAHPPFDVNAVRRDFPILEERVNGYPLAWLDNAATTQKPQCVIDRISEFYRHENSNIHRAAHELAARATDAYEGARATVAGFINASSADDIVFVRGATEAINLVAQSWGRQFIGEGDEIVISWLEHHANIVPWQQLCRETGALLRVIPVDDDGQVILAEYQKLLNAKTKLVSFTQVSNALGTVTPAAEMIALAHQAGAKVLLDGAQSVSHLRVDVQSLDCDWLVFSGHKIFGPTGIGVLYGKPELLAITQPWQGGGNMIEDVTFEKTVYQPAPAKFEAGTGNIADAVGLGAALEYLSRIGIENVARYEHELLEYGMHILRGIPGVRLIGTAPDKTSVLSFVMAGHSTQEVGKALNDAGIAVRSGHHCAQPILRRFGLEATVRPSLAFYNTYDEIDRLAAVLKKLQCAKRNF